MHFILSQKNAWQGTLEALEVELYWDHWGWRDLHSQWEWKASRFHTWVPSGPGLAHLPAISPPAIQEDKGTPHRLENLNNCSDLPLDQDKDQRPITASWYAADILYSFNGKDNFHILLLGTAWNLINIIKVDSEHEKGWVLSIRMFCLFLTFSTIYRIHVLFNIFIFQTNKPKSFCIELFNRQNWFKSTLYCSILLCI